MMKREIEILAPAGSWDSLMAGICAGADAVYIGGSRFGARAYADNLDEEQMLRAIDYVHLHGRKIYMTVNTLLKETELAELYDYLVPYYRQGLDAVIVQDIGAMRYIQEAFPGLAIHVSTQATVTNVHGAEFFKELGATRIVPARELSLSEIQDMKERTGLEIECFVHGALCYCYSGQCLMSSMIGGRSGNRGQCAQPCRLPYRVSGNAPADVLSLKDLCTIDLIPELVDAGIDSFKIEGRMKQPDYVYTVTSMYRKYTDLYLEQGRKGYQVSAHDRRKLMDIYRRRGYCEGYYKKQNGREMLSLKRPSIEQEILKETIPYKIQEKINGKLRLSEGECAKLSLGLKRGDCLISVTVYGDKVQTAMKQPLEKDRIEKQMRKTGNTQFIFDVFETEICGRVFLPMQSLNELRREGIAQLEQEIKRQYRRNTSAVKGWEEKRSHDLSERPYNSSARLEASIQTARQLKKVLEFADIQVIYIDGNIGLDRTVKELIRKGHDRGNVNIYLSMPHIFRERALKCYERDYEKLTEYYDGVLIRGWEEYHWLKMKGYEGRIISDSNMYVFNSRSRQFIAGKGICNHTSSIELNYRELKNLGPGGILTVYGYQPVMVTANCIHKTCGKCTGKEEVLYLTDRCKKRFAVKNYCKYCYNIIYNSSPLMLLDQTEEIESLRPSGIRLDFTQEKEDEMAFVIDLYRRAFLRGEDVKFPDMEYTRGHFKRGVK